MKTLLLTITCLLLTVISNAQQAESMDLLPDSTFTPGIEGPAVDKDGNLYAVNYAKEGTIGIVRPDGSHEVYITLPDGSVGNGIRFDKNGFMYIANYTEHEILCIDPQTKEISIFAHDSTMNQPNDIAIAPNGIMYASDPNWADETGKLWMITPNGQITCLETNLGTTNGIEVSPNGKWLYVGESTQRRILAFTINENGALSNRQIFCTFPDFGLDGMRCDAKGNLYITRYDKGTVVIFSPEGKLMKEIQLKGSKPSNITFGGPERKRCYVTMADRGCFEYFEAEYPGRE